LHQKAHKRNGDELPLAEQVALVSPKYILSRAAKGALLKELGQSSSLAADSELAALRAQLSAALNPQPIQNQIDKLVSFSLSLVLGAEKLSKFVTESLASL